MGAHHVVKLARCETSWRRSAPRSTSSSPPSTSTSTGAPPPGARPEGPPPHGRRGPLPDPRASLPLITHQRSISARRSARRRRSGTMLEFCARHGIEAVTEHFPMREVNEALEHLGRRGRPAQRSCWTIRADGASARGTPRAPHGQEWISCGRHGAADAGLSAPLAETPYEPRARIARHDEQVDVPLAAGSQPRSPAVEQWCGGGFRSCRGLPRRRAKSVSAFAARRVPGERDPLSGPALPP